MRNFKVSTRDAFPVIVPISAAKVNYSSYERRLIEANILLRARIEELESCCKYYGELAERNWWMYTKACKP